MRVVSNKSLVDFAAAHPDSGSGLQAWRKVIETGSYQHFAALNAVLNATDRVGDFYMFDVGGNKYRIIAAIHFNRQMLFVRHVFTHAQYNTWKRNP